MFILNVVIRGSQLLFSPVTNRSKNTNKGILIFSISTFIYLMILICLTPITKLWIGSIMNIIYGIMIFMVCVIIFIRKGQKTFINPFLKKDTLHQKLLEEPIMKEYLKQYLNETGNGQLYNYYI